MNFVHLHWLTIEPCIEASVIPIQIAVQAQEPDQDLAKNYFFQIWKFAMRFARGFRGMPPPQEVF